MKLGDVYKHKKNNSLIQIDSYATPMGRFDKGKEIIVFRKIVPYSIIGSSPAFNGYGSQEEIENEYELLVPQEELSNYSDWNEILELVEES